MSVTNTAHHPRRQIKGFAHSTIASRVSNTLSTRMISVCKRSHGEHVAARKTKRNQTSGHTKLSLNGCDAHSVTVPNAHEIDMTVKRQKYVQLQRCISEAFAAGVTEESALEMVNKQHAQLIAPRESRHSCIH